MLADWPVVVGVPWCTACRLRCRETISAMACVSAAEPDRQHHTKSCTMVSLSVTRLAMMGPVVVRESAPISHASEPKRSSQTSQLKGLHTEDNSILERHSHAVVLLDQVRSLDKNANLHRCSQATKTVSQAINTGINIGLVHLLNLARLQGLHIDVDAI